ncbi:hypothetical protein [Sphingopyxis sp.]|uniref:hypothetical protein n=1 Tax=Sphingopyxis sp. TaxID=1908224 RepID=UPI00260BDA75|nr:hypothetical protein [Sphingopyxis sp.]MCW0198638.1 hypothetical protein [Sphingopyxis sp.]
MANNIREDAGLAAQIVADAGGTVVGRTKLQKLAFILKSFELDDVFEFEYKHYGPYSDELSTAVKYAEVLGALSEEVKTANWGGRYSIFTTTPSDIDKTSVRAKILEIGNRADPVDLELAATAILLAQEGFDDPWSETASRKPEKAAGGRLDRARVLLDRFKELDTEKKLPANC